VIAPAIAEKPTVGEQVREPRGLDDPRFRTASDALERGRIERLLELVPANAALARQACRVSFMRLLRLALGTPSGRRLWTASRRSLPVARLPMRTPRGS
jgi:hypothetical protein